MLDQTDLPQGVGSGLAEVTSPASVEAPVLDSMALLTELFVPEDFILLRPIETWSEGGLKKSKVIYEHVTHAVGDEKDLLRAVGQQVLASERTHANCFFGVAPRFGRNQEYDLAFQIRTIRVLWADVDNCTPEEAIQRCLDAGIPRPSAVVSSGNGAHLYWFLIEPYLIDDIGDPPAVKKEWAKVIVKGQEKNRPIKFFMDPETNERVNLDDPKTGVALPNNVPDLSPKALRAQEVMSGIAVKISGDHTFDLSRLLRVPTSLNRKDERNGRKAVPCRLVECSGARYAFSDFERFAVESPSAKKREILKSVSLPTVRKLSAGRTDKLNQLVTKCAIAEPGFRSEADFAVCAFAVEQGISRDEVWSRVADVGKFADRGESYFSITWEKAEESTRLKIVERLDNPSLTSSNALRPATTARLEMLPSDSHDDNEADDRPEIHIDPHLPIAGPLRSITLLLKDGCQVFRRAGTPVQITDSEITAIESPQRLAGVLSAVAEVVVHDRDGQEYKPLPLNYASTWLMNPVERALLPQITCYTKCPVFTEDWRLAPPGYDPASGIFYAGPVVNPGSGTECIDTLLRDFCFAKPADRTNFIGICLTALLGPRFIGRKPGVLLNGNQPSIGKTTVAQCLAVFRDGHTVESATYNQRDEEFEKRLCSIVRNGTSTIIVDNAKRAQGERNLLIESAVLERSITDQILSFRLLGHSTDVRAENIHQFVITANNSECSRDLVTRCVPVSLFLEGDPTQRTYSLAKPEDYAAEHRLEILAELVGMVERWKAAGQPRSSICNRFTEWAALIGGILDANGEPDFLANVSDAAAEMDQTRREFGELVLLMYHKDCKPGSTHSGPWTPGELVELAISQRLLECELGDGSMRSRATCMGRILSRYIGGTFDVGSGTSSGDSPDLWKFHKRESGNNKTYSIVQVDGAPSC